MGRSLLVRLCLHITLIKCLKGYKSLGSLLKVVQLQLVWESETTHPPTYSLTVLEMLKHLKSDNMLHPLWTQPFWKPEIVSKVFSSSGFHVVPFLMCLFSSSPLTAYLHLRSAMHPIYWQFAQILSSIFHSFHSRSKCVTKSFTLSQGLFVSGSIIGCVHSVVCWCKVDNNEWYEDTL